MKKIKELIFEQTFRWSFVKVAGVIIVLSAMIISWRLTYPERIVSESDEEQLFAELVQLIEEEFKKQVPGVGNFEFRELWSQAKGKNRLEVVFGFTFHKPSAEETIQETVEGRALLERMLIEGGEQWSLVDFKTTGNALNFSKGLIVYPDPDAKSGEKLPTNEEMPKEQEKGT